MVSSTIRLLSISIAALALTACLEKGGSASQASSAPSASVIAQSVSALDSAGNCNSGKEGALVYNRSDSAFYVCEGGDWITINIRGDKGDTGNSGSQGSTGANGATGPQGPQGPQGPRGPAGTGAPAGMVIRDGSGNVAARVVQFNTGRYNGLTAGQAVLVMYDGGELIWLNTVTGRFDGRPEMIYHTGENCTGTAYIRPRGDSSPDILNRVYIGKIQNDAYHLAYKIVGFDTGTIQTVSRREYNIDPGTGACFVSSHSFNSSSSGVGPVPRVEVLPVTTYQDLTALAPLRIEAE